jgi:hypothetical protein
MKKIAWCLLGLLLGCGSVFGQTGAAHTRIVTRVSLKGQTAAIPPTARRGEADQEFLGTEADDRVGPGRPLELVLRVG